MQSRSSARGGSLLEFVAAVAVLLLGLLGFSRALSASLALGATNRATALASAAAQGIVEELFATDSQRAFALYNDDPDDDPDGPGTAPGARFEAPGLPARAGDAGPHGRILFPVTAGRPGELREDLNDSKLRPAFDLDLDGALDDADHSGDYRLLPVLVRVEWQDGRATRELELATILGAR